MDQGHNLLEQNQAGDTFVSRVGIGKMSPQVAGAHCPQESVPDGVDEDVGIGVPGQPQGMGYFHRA
jgi:hypothetical protein